jgi:cyclase
MTTAHVPDHVDLPPPHLEEVSEGVFAYVQPDGSWGLNNTGFILGRDAILAVDTCFTERRARAFRDAIRSVSGLPVRGLVNTHHHGDHTHGNFVFRPEAVIIGHELCRKEILETGLGSKAFFPGVDWGEIEIEPPTVVFQNWMAIYIEELRVELVFVGPAHTSNDVIVWLPDRRVLFTGDILFNGGTPFALMGSVKGWLEALDRLRSLGAERIVPGHGDICGPEVIDDVAEYLLFLQEVARRGYEAGVSPLEIARDTDLGRFGEWLDRERLVGNLHRAYSELRGEPRGTPLNLAAAIADMVVYNGGQLPRCLA